MTEMLFVILRIFTFFFILALAWGLVKVIYLWWKSRDQMKKAELLPYGFWKWLYLCIRGIQTGYVLRNYGVGIELRVSMQYWYQPTSVSCANFLVTLFKVNRNTIDICDQRIQNIIRFITSSYKVTQRGFRMSPAGIGDALMPSFQIDSAVVIALAMAFGDRKMIEEGDADATENKLRLSKPELNKIRNYDSELYKCIQDLKAGLPERVHSLMHRLTIRAHVEVSELTSMTYLIDALEMQDVFDDTQRTIIVDYIKNFCKRPRLLDDGTTIGEEGGLAPMGYALSAEQRWSCTCATAFALSIFKNIGLFKDQNYDHEYQEMGQIIRNLFTNRWDHSVGSFSSRPKDKPVVISLRYGIKLLRWASTTQSIECPKPENFWEGVSDFLNNCRVPEDNRCLFAFSPGKRGNILATRFALEIDEMYRKIEGSKNATLFPDLALEELEKSVWEAFYDNDRHSVIGIK